MNQLLDNYQREQQLATQIEQLQAELNQVRAQNADAWREVLEFSNSVDLQQYLGQLREAQG